MKLCFMGGKISNNNILSLGIAMCDYIQGSKLENVFIKNFNVHGNLSQEIENEFGITKENIENNDFIESYKYEIFFYLLQSDCIIGYDISNLKSELFKILPEGYYARTLNKLRFIDIKGMNNDTSLFELFKNCFKNEYSIPNDLNILTIKKELNAIKQCFLYLDKKVGIISKSSEEIKNDVEKLADNETRVINKIENSIYKPLLEKWGDNPEALNFIEHIIDGNKSIFLTGEAGTGKSTLIKNLITCNKNSGEEPIILGSTGMSAMNIGGKTAHSFFNLGVAPIYYKDMLKKIKNNKKGKLFSLNKDKLEIIKRAPFIIIDEVSMLSSNIVDCINAEMAYYVGNDLNFGGKQIIFIGDIYQLPPVTNKNWRNKFGKKYPSEWFFDSDTFKGKMSDLIDGIFDYRIINLKKNYRQGGDIKFRDILSRVRCGNITDEDINILNSKDSVVDPDYIYLSTHNDTVDRINNERLLNLKGKEFVFRAEVLGNFPKDMRKNNEEISLKRGAKIMMINNNDPDWVNGTLGEVLDIDENDESIMVKLENGKIRNVEKYTWKYSDFVMKDGELKEVILGSYKQIPVQLAYAITVHKSQGLTFTNCQMNLPNTFQGGQGYTALTRVTNLNGLKLDGCIAKDILYFSPRVIEFEKEMEEKIIRDKKLDNSISKDGDLKISINQGLSELKNMVINNEIPYIINDKILKEDYERFKRKLGIRDSYPTHLDYLREDSPNLLVFLKSKTKGRKNKSYYKFLKGIGECNIPKFSDKEIEFIDGIENLLPLVRKDEYLLVKSLLDDNKIKREKILVNNSSVTSESINKAVENLQRIGILVGEDLSLKDINEKLKQYLLNVIQYGIVRFNTEFGDFEDQFKLYGNYYKEQIPMLLGIKPMAMMLKGTYFDKDGITYVFVGLKKDKSKEERTNYKDKFISSSVLQWESENNTTYTNQRGKAIQNTKNIHVFVREMDEKNGIILPFIYLGIGKFTNIKESFVENQLTNERYPTLLTNILLDNKVPQEYFDEFDIELE